MLSPNIDGIGATGQVFAVDVQPEMIRMLESLARASSLANIKPVPGKPDQVNLASGCVDPAADRQDIAVATCHRIQKAVLTAP